MKITLRMFEILVLQCDVQPAVSVTIGWLLHAIPRDLFSREVHVNHAAFLKA